MFADIPILVVVAYLFSGFGVIMFGVHEFPKAVSSDTYKGLIARARPCELTSERSFQIARVVYVFGLVLIFASFSALLRPLLPWVPDLKDKVIEEPIFPVVAAFCLIGFLPYIPKLRLLEVWWREFMHGRASIPRAIHDLVAEIDSRVFAYSRLPKTVLARIIPFGDQDKPLASLKEAQRRDRLSIGASHWILTSAIMNSILIAKSDIRAAKRIGLGFIRRHAEHLNSLLFEYKELEEVITNRRASLNIDELNKCADDYSEKIAELLEKAKIFVACLLVSRPSHVALEEALDCLFFDDARRLADVSRNQDEQDNLILASFVGLLTPFMLYLIFPFFDPLLPSGLSESWPDPATFGSELFSWLLVQLRYLPVPFGLLWYRHWRIVARNNWFDRERQRVRPVEYAKLVVPALLASAVIGVLARALQMYIWKHDMSAATFFLSFLDTYWLSVVTISLFSISLIILFDSMRYPSKLDPISFSIMAMAVLSILTIAVGKQVYPKDMGAFVTHFITTVVFFAVVLSTRV